MDDGTQKDSPLPPVLWLLYIARTLNRAIAGVERIEYMAYEISPAPTPAVARTNSVS